MSRPIKKIAINTGGGDAPGLNAVIRAVVLSALNRGWECYGIREGFRGIFEPKFFPGGGVIPLTRESVNNITHLGGTILGATNRGNPLEYPMTDASGNSYKKDRTDEIISFFEQEGLDALIALGGDGSMGIANALSKKGLRVIGIPKTIDNDLNHTVITFGFDTAVSFATECIDRLKSTAQSHNRVIVVEVMGRYAGWIALNSGISADAHVILIPEIPYSWEKIVAKIQEREENGKRYSIVVVAEGAFPQGGSVSVVEKKLDQEARLGGVGERVTKEIEARTGKEARLVVLGHLLRGGSPTTFDRLISLRFGAAAIRALEEGKTGVMVALDPPKVKCVPLDLVTERNKQVPLDGDSIMTARDLGISFAD